MVSKFCSIFSAFFDNLSILWKLQSFMTGVQSQSRKSVIFTFHGFNPFAPGDFPEKRVLKLVEWFSGHCRAIKS